MPPLPNQPGVLKIDHHFTIGEDIAALCRWHVRYIGSAPTAADLNTFATYLSAQWLGSMVGLYHTTTALTAIDITDLTTPTSAFGSNTTPHAGGLVGQEQPAATCLLCTYHIARRYRGGKPRTYWPFGDADQLSDPQTWTVPFLSNCQTGIDQYFNATTFHAVGPATTQELVSISQYHGFTPVLNPITGRTRDVPTVRPVAIAPDLLGPPIIHPRPATQRRRALNR